MRRRAYCRPHRERQVRRGAGFGASTSAARLINADAMQVYAEAPILTAQPDAATRARKRRICFTAMSRRAKLYSVGRYAEDARRALAEVRAMGKLPIFVGGTGLYFTALTQGLADIPPIPAGDPRESPRAAG